MEEVDLRKAMEAELKAMQAELSKRKAMEEEPLSSSSSSKRPRLTIQGTDTTPLKGPNSDESPEHPTDESTKPSDSESTKLLTDREPTEEELYEIARKLYDADEDELEYGVDGFCLSCTFVPGAVCKVCGFEQDDSQLPFIKQCNACHSNGHSTFLCPDVTKVKKLADFEYQYMKQHNMI